MTIFKFKSFNTSFKGAGSILEQAYIQHLRVEESAAFQKEWTF